MRLILNGLAALLLTTPLVAQTALAAAATNEPQLSDSALVEEKMTRRNGNRQYWRSATFELFVAEPFVVRWVFDAAGHVMGAGLNPLSQAPSPDP